MSARTCPACSRRYGGLIDAGCVVCAGDGVLQLADAGLHKNDPSVVALAVERYLEATLAATVRAELDATDTAHALVTSIHELVHAGLLRDRAGLAPS